jgi:hypothetical protein
VIYNAEEIKQWDTQTEINGKWVCARPQGSRGFMDRLRTAWVVLKGECDALEWFEQ